MHHFSSSKSASQQFEFGKFGKIKYKTFFDEKKMQVMIGAGSGLAPFRGFWQHLMKDSLCSDGSRVVEKVSFYEAVKMKAGSDNGNNLDDDGPGLLARKARLEL